MKTNSKEVYDPVSTYRIQFSAEFTFKDLQPLIPYLDWLGIRTIYASPVFTSMKGSGHGYDVTDPWTINPEIGTIEDLRSLREELDNHSMGWIQDIVPNHMAYHPSNPWISDIFRHGPRSEYFHYFDVDWNHWQDVLKGKVLLPFFGRKVDELLQEGELKTEFNGEDLVLTYYENSFPLSFTSWPFILKLIPSAAYTPRLEEVAFIFRESRFSEGVEKIAGLWAEDQESKAKIVDALLLVNEDDQLMLKLLDLQYFLPVFWKTSERMINYRRFFTINDLISLRMDDPEVFSQYHRLIGQLTREGLFNGLRVDHIDGLYHPGRYLRRLRNMTGDKTCLIVEKILEKDEKLKAGWPLQGTTGYEFTSLVNNLFTNETHAGRFMDIYRRIDEKIIDYEQLIYEKKQFILYNRMAGDLENLVHRFLSLPGMPDPAPDTRRLTDAVAEFLIQCPVYKIYPDFEQFTNDEEEFIRGIFRRAISHLPALEHELRLLQTVFLYEGLDEELRRAGMDFFRRCMQYTGPLMAKGLEDTAFYSYARFIAHNEVGDSPGYFGIRNSLFHREMEDRLHDHPLSLNASSTHDSKRGEDSRARLSIVSDIPETWENYVREWLSIGKEIRKKDGIPTLNDEYFIYQSMTGSYPVNLEHDEVYVERLTGYILKSVREAKDNTSWTEPDERYEELTVQFTKDLTENGRFMNSFRSFLRIVVDPGLVCSLSQLLLKNTCPGVPDLYRGSETWNFSFVDPDNRRPVDYDQLRTWMNAADREGDQRADVFKSLWDERTNGRVKQWLTRLTLNERLENSEFFQAAAYIPLKLKGKYKNNILAFMRYQEGRWCLVAVPVLFGCLQIEAGGEFTDIDWRNTRIEMPELSPGGWKDLLTGDDLPSGKSIYLNDLFARTPVAFLIAETTPQSRSAGILLHISSLPGEYGTGDFGREAFRFVDFLQRNGQTRWQILPLSYVDQNSGYSPYSSLSAFAGNILFIDPQRLCDTGLVREIDLYEGICEETDEASFREAEIFRNRLIGKAWRRFRERNMPLLKQKFENFCKQEAWWLNDFSLFCVIRELQDHKKWNLWPGALRDREEGVLENYTETHRERIGEIKFGQFLFREQWCDLKAYANRKGIDIIGDIPFYVDYDSADVWANPDLFRLNADKSMEVVAGVPPDYFNDEGQLWNMPVYRWDLMKERHYTWWKKRLEKNLELFDLLRIDHFRAFSDYWQVPAGEQTAVNGEWRDGPGTDFFEDIRKEFPQMPFIAEDLGDVNQAVYDLRDRYGLPGMNVLQFAFGDDMAESVHALHNHKRNSIVYTGTHDNNTIRGWYKNELDHASRKRLKQYAGRGINRWNVHRELIRMAFRSPARTVIIPMQDYLALDSGARMNRPSTNHGNWKWRMEHDDILSSVEKTMQRFTRIYARLEKG